MVGAAECYHLGLPMWSNRHWSGSLFPAGANSKNYLRHYSEVFNTVEGNTTFYALPSKEVVQQWLEQLQPDFQFCFKLPKKITHENYLRYSNVELSEFIERLTPLHSFLGPFMIQLSDSFEPRQLDDLKRFINILPADFRFSVEVRHRDFFNKGDEEKALNQLLIKHGVDRVCFDSRALFSKPALNEEDREAHRKKPRLPVHVIATSNRPIIRFVGCSDQPHNEQYLLPWVNQIKKWQQQNIRPLFFIHMANNRTAPEQAAKFHQLLSDIPGWRPLAKTIKDEDQLSIF